MLFIEFNTGRTSQSLSMPSSQPLVNTRLESNNPYKNKTDHFNSLISYGGSQEVQLCVKI